jgi:PST family polysaccharide transporter
MDAELLTETTENGNPAPQEDAAGVSLKSRTLQGAAWLSFEGVGVQAASFGVFATMAHFVTPRDFGLISISFIGVQSLQILAFYHVPTIAMRKQQTSDADFTTAFWITIAFAILAFLLLFQLSGLAEKLFHAPGLKPVLRSMSFILLFMGLSRTHETWLTRHFRFKSLAVRGLSGALVGGITGVVLAIKGFGADALVAQQIVNSTVTTALLWTVCPWRPNFRFSRSAAMEIFGFMRDITFNNVIYVVNQNCDVFLIALVFGPIGTGFYNIGKRIRLALQLVTGEPVKNIMLPALAEMQKDETRLRGGILNSLTFVCVICSPVFFGTSAISHDLIVLIFGQKWVHAVPILQLLALSGLAVVLLGYNDNIFILKHKPLWCLWVSLAYTMLAILAIFVCRQANVTSIALPFVLPYLVVLPFSSWLAARQTGISFRELCSAILPGLASATIMLIALLLLAPHIQSLPLLARVLLLGLSGAGIYAGVLAGIWPRTTKHLLRIGRK